MRPWLGVSSLEEDDQIRVVRVSDDGPAAQAGLEPGDILLAMGGKKLDNLADFHAAISGLNVSTQKVDLGGFKYSTSETVAWAQSGTSWTLTVKDGAKTATLKLIGSYVGSDFHLSNDGHGDTTVADPPAASPTTDPAPPIRKADVNPRMPTPSRELPTAESHDDRTTTALAHMRRWAISTDCRTGDSKPAASDV